jgi:hypothetical protein
MVFCATPDDHVVVVHGAAAGADTHAGGIARSMALQVEEFPADWDKHGKKAGPIRNREMLATKPDLVIACRMMGVSRGTDDMIAIAVAAGVPVRIIYEDGRMEYR